MAQKRKKRLRINDNPSSENCGNIEDSFRHKIGKAMYGNGIEDMFKNEKELSPHLNEEKNFLREVDGRTRRARSMKSFYEAIMSDIGGKDSASLAEMEIARRCSALAVIANEMENALASGDLDNFDFEQFIILARTQSSLFRIIGTKRRTKKVEDRPSLDTYLNAKERYQND